MELARGYLCLIMDIKQIVIKISLSIFAFILWYIYFSLISIPKQIHASKYLLVIISENSKLNQNIFIDINYRNNNFKELTQF